MHTEEEKEIDPKDQKMVVVLQEDSNPNPEMRRRRIRRREMQPFTQEERLQIVQEIISANTSMREVEATKTAQVKVWNGLMAEYETTMNNAIDVLKVGAFNVDIERVEEFDYKGGVVRYYDTEDDSLIEEREMTEEEKQTKMDM